MKLWLFDILACPICKSYPLEFYIFSYQTKEDEFKEYLSTYEKQERISYEDQEIIQISYEDENNVLIKDDVVIEEKPIPEYLDALLSSIEELNNIKDLSNYKASNKCIQIAKNTIYDRLSEFSQKSDPDKIENIISDLIFLNKLKINVEVETGILFCNECKRWYPIIETIPRMLPDQYREKEKEIEFLRNNKDLLDEKFLSQDLKPFNL